MATIKFIVRGDSETASIYVRFKEGRLIDVTGKTKFIIDSNNWSETKGQPKNLKNASAKSLWGDLVAFQSDLLDHYNKCNNKLEINSQWLKEFINPPIKQKAISDRLVNYFDYYLLHKTNELSEASRKKLKVIKHLVQRFETEMKSKFLVKDVDLNFKLKFENYCKEQNYAPNTIARAINFIKTVCYHARFKRIETNHELDSLTTKYEASDKIYLNREELKRIEKVKLENDNYLNARDWLLISCETGQRVSDFLDFKKEHIRRENGKALIEFTQVKTKKIMTVPLSKKVLEILKKRKGEFPKAMSDQKYNTYIKDVCELAGITQKINGSKKDKKTKRKVTGMFPKFELISSHVGRRSFSTNNYGKIPTSLLIGATGHSTEKMFLEYIGKSDTQKALQLAEYF